MSDIQSGDVVVCVDDRPTHEGLTAPFVVGRTYRVEIAKPCPPSFMYAGEQMLTLAGVATFGIGWREKRFRKIGPAEEEFTTLIRNMKPLRTRKAA